MTITAKRVRFSPRPGGVVALREEAPRGASQFSGVVDTPTAHGKPRQPKVTRPRAELAKGLSTADIKALGKTEKRYAASRRAATSNGRDIFYD